VARIVRGSAGIQAQVQSAAVLAVAQRRATPRTGEVDSALWRDRTVVKTWAMRGTLHLLAADDLPVVVGTMSSLHPWTAPSYQKYFGVTAREVERVRDAIGEILADRVLTREELGAEVSKRIRSKGVSARLGSGWGELLKPAAFAGLLVQGPPREGRVTYTRPDTWLGTELELLEPVEAGAELTRRYLRAHGPATAKDIAYWWARQSVTKVRPWLARLGDEVVEVSVDGEAHLALAEDLDSLHRQQANDDVRLLPAFDQYVLAAARDIEHLVPAGHRDEVFRKINGWIAATVVVGGRVVGTWEKDGSDVALNMWQKAPKRALDAEVERVTSLIRSTPEVEDDR
jgi:winged helix DNA-binding protein